MAVINGKRFSKEDMLKRVGNISQLARVRPFEFTEGKAGGIKAFDIVNGGGLEFTVLEGKCLDLYEARYKGVNLNFVSKPGLVSPYLADLYGMGNSFLRNVSGGCFIPVGCQTWAPQPMMRAWTMSSTEESGIYRLKRSV